MNNKLGGDITDTYGAHTQNVSPDLCGGCLQDFTLKSVLSPSCNIGDYSGHIFYTPSGRWIPTGNLTYIKARMAACKGELPIISTPDGCLATHSPLQHSIDIFSLSIIGPPTDHEEQ